jgi:hypothetical protein
MHNFGYVLIGLVICLVAASFSCSRKTTLTKHTRDTVYVAKVDTILIPTDTVFAERVYTTIDSVFMEVEKDCPNIDRSKVKQWTNKVKEVCTIEQLTGGKLKVYSPFLKDSVTIHFKDNSGVVILSGYDTLVNDKTVTTIVKEPSFWMLVKEYYWTGLLLLFIGFLFGVWFRR